MRILLWHVHGSWTTAFVEGPNCYVLPVLPDRGPDGRGRARTWTWPDRAIEVAPHDLGDQELDLVVLQRPHEADLLREWTGLRAGFDVPAVYVEHNAPRGLPTDSVHPMSERSDVPIVHVTHFNRMYWDNGRAPTAVIEHGIPDPGYRWTGDIARAAVVVNEPVRRHRITGSDIVSELAVDLPIDLFGDGITGFQERYGIPAGAVRLAGGLDQARLHEELARRRVYVHTARWTSLGLSLLEAMHLGLPVVAVAATEVHRAVPPAAGVVSNDFEELRDGIRTFINEPKAAAEAGRVARSWALEHYGLAKFLAAWQALMEERTR